MAEGQVDFEVYGYDANDHQENEVCYKFSEAKKAAYEMRRKGLGDIKIVKTDGWDLYQSWEFVNGKFTRTE